MRLVCFDVDGTLIWTDGAGRRAIHRALLEELGTAGPIASFRFDGRTDGEIVWRLAEAAGVAVDAGLVKRVLARYVTFLAAELARPEQHTRVYPGVRQLLAALGARPDCVVGLLTGNIAPGARLKLDSAGLDFESFRVGAFGSDSIERAELPAIARRRASDLLGVELSGTDVVIVGDTPADMRCGRLIGARAIGVATAAYSVEELLASGAKRAFVDFTDTAAVIGAMLG